MWKVLKFTGKYFLISLAVLCGSLPALAESVIKVGAVHAPPWIDFQGEKVRGYDYDFLHSIARRMKVRLEFVQMNYRDLLSGLEAGDVDIAASLLFRKDWDGFVRFISPPYRTKIRTCFFTRKGSGLTADRYIDLAGHRAAVVQGVRYFPIFDLDDRMIKVSYPSQEEAFLALSRGDVDFSVCTEFSATHYLQELAINSMIECSPFKYSPKLMPTYLGVSRRSSFISRVDELSSVVGQMQGTGVLDELAVKYSVRLH